MEVLLGFAFGYWVGTRQGRQGLQEALGNVQAIMAHPETRRLLSEGIAADEQSRTNNGGENSVFGVVTPAYLPARLVNNSVSVAISIFPTLSPLGVKIGLM